MYGTTTDDASLAVRLNIEKNIQQTWGAARMAGRITEGDYQRQTEEHENNMAQLLAKPTPTIYIYLTETGATGETCTIQTIYRIDGGQF